MAHPPHRDALDTALAHHAAGRLAEAEAICRGIVGAQPDHADALHLLGMLAYESGELLAARTLIARAIALQPNAANFHNNLGLVLEAEGRGEDALLAFGAALQIRPDFAEAHANLGGALCDLRRTEAAIAECRAALALQPDFAEAHCILGNALREEGRGAEAIASHRRAVESDPGNALLHSTLIFALQCAGAEGLRDEQARWNARHATMAMQPHDHDANPVRRLKVGYVSPDFRHHSIAHFLLPLLEAHDRAEVEVFCYSSVPRPDAVTQRMARAAGVWRDVRTLPDADLAARIRADGIDILVDLTMHSAHNRLPVFARKPAPVQVSWLAYPGGTGLDRIDWRLTDPHLDRAPDAFPLPDCWCCFAPIAEFPPVSGLPALSTDGVTFGSLNSFAKVNDAALRCWARILAAVPMSRLLMVCPEGRSRARVAEFFGAHSTRVEFASHRPFADFVQLAERIDIALDTFPCQGMTTTCHALWMGLPVVALAGVGRSVLSAIGCAEWAVDSEDAYVRRAVHLASDLPRLAEWRATMRARMERSPLMDAPRFARNVERAYRSMWERWCSLRS